ncbi:MAG: DUF2974 domain-containing protein [Bifidobacteriaceae bacterium]|nr:DUF2974 domain-containing protein [Bifidobacteriaceae bacterium]
MDYGTNIESYLGWRGDIPFSVSPFSQIDALVLCKLCYFDLSAVGDGSEDAGSVTAASGVSLAACADRAGDAIAYKGLIQEGPDFFMHVAHTERFGSVHACHYVSTDPATDGTQFSATEYRLPDGRGFVAFRGTDATIVGWKEDFELSFQQTEAQKRARAYLLDALASAQARGAHLLVGGHSKGANLAHYATVGLADEQLAHIDAIYLLDGPGIAPEVIPGAPSPAWTTRVTRIIPSFSVFGRLFEPAIPPLVVRSSAEGLFQHELLSWQLSCGKLDLAAAPDPESDYCAAAFHQWLDGVSLADRQEFTDDLFAAIGQAGSTTTDIAASMQKNLPLILNGLAHSRPGAKKTAAAMPLRTFLRAIADSVRRQRLPWRRRR